MINGGFLLSYLLREFLLYFVLPVCVFLGVLWGFVALIKFFWMHS
jgi:hypothetical protein